MNIKLKKILSIFIILIVGYAQIGCQSSDEMNEKNHKVVKEYSKDDNKESLINKDKESDISIKSSSNANIHFINTGNSDAILIIQNGKAALIDGGDNDDEKLVVKYIKKQGISELEYVFATHPHSDHIGGLDAVADEIKINNLYVSNGELETKTYRDFIESASNKGLSPSVPLINSEFKLGASTFKVLSAANGEDPNNNSIVLLYTNGSDKILLMGDAEADIEAKINPGDVDLLKVGHHGSHSSSTKAFVDKVNPEYAVILAGKDNKYGHPHIETMDLLKRKGIEVHRSDECKDIVVISTGEGLKVNCDLASYKSGSNSKDSNDKVVLPNTNISSSENIIENKNNETIYEQPLYNSDKVYWSASGKRYHSDPSCSGMKNPILGTIDESGRSACSKCY